jgi:8-oxo-dGTP pyrophosphatase MutT (NUDIX family)
MSLNYDFCNNCGKNGHVYHQCKKPIISLGIILFQKTQNDIKYLMICRKDSLGYIDFLRGKYLLNNKKYILNLINEMTIKEKQNLITMKFDELWKNLWGERLGLQYKNEEKIARDKFETLKSGVNLGYDIEFNLVSLIKESNTNWITPEWGFPKGRRNNQEKDLSTAIREFEEETGISRNKIDLIANVFPLSEIFMGSNLKSYLHKYYLASCKETSVETRIQQSEVSDLKWLTLKECLNKIRSYNLEKMILIKNVEKVLHKYSLIL